MHLLYVVSQYPARSETFIIREAQQLVEMGHDVTLARLRWSDTQSGERLRGARVLPMPLAPGAIGRALAEMPRHVPRLKTVAEDVLRASGPLALRCRLGVIALSVLANVAALCEEQPVDHVRAHFLDSEAIGAAWTARILQVPYSLTVQTTSVRFDKDLVRRVVQGAAFCAATTAETAAFLSETGWAGRILRVRSGVDVASTPQRSSGVPVHEPARLIAVGRLVPKKGFSDLIAAVHRQQRPVHLTIYGEGPERDRLARQIQEANLQEVVHLAGGQPFAEVQRAYATSDLLVVPSRVDPMTNDRDGLPNVIIEASAAGLPVVATRIAGIPDLIEDGVTGRLVQPGDRQALAAAIGAGLEAYGQSIKMAGRARACVRERYSLDGEVSRLEAEIRTVHGS